MIYDEKAASVAPLAANVGHSVSDARPRVLSKYLPRASIGVLVVELRIMLSIINAKSPLHHAQGCWGGRPGETATFHKARPEDAYIAAGPFFLAVPFSEL